MNVVKHFVMNRRDRFVDDIEILSNAVSLDIFFSNRVAGTNYYYLLNDTNTSIVLTSNAVIDVTSSLTVINTSNPRSPFRIYLPRGIDNIRGIRFGRGSGSSGSRIRVPGLIQNFLARFKNIEHFAIDYYTYGVTTGLTIIEGDLGALPNSIKKVYINTPCIQNMNTKLPLNLNSYNSESLLEYFYYGAQYSYASSTSKLKVIGDIGNIPPNVSYFWLNGTAPSTLATDSAVNYIKRKTWKSTFDTFQCLAPIVTHGALTVKDQVDNLLIDMNNSITTSVGGKTIAVNGARSTASDAAVAGLQAKGFTITPALAT